MMWTFPLMDSAAKRRVMAPVRAVLARQEIKRGRQLRRIRTLGACGARASGARRRIPATAPCHSGYGSGANAIQV
jgi:hypothetical protein